MSCGRCAHDPFRDAQLLRDRADVMTKKLLSPIRVLSTILRAGNTQLSGAR